MRRFGRRLGWVIRLALITYLLTLAAVLGAEWAWPRDSLPAAADTIVCLGGAAFDGRLSTDSQSRAERCVALYQAGVAPAIVFTGAGAAFPMTDVAIAQGVPASAVGSEPFSYSTLQNALFTARFMSVSDRVVVVTNAYHLPRSWMSFKVMGYSDVTLVAADQRTTRPRPLLREPLAIWFNLGRAALWLATPWLDLDIREMLLV